MSNLLTAKDLADYKLIGELKLRIEKETDSRCLIDESLAKHTSWRVGGPARLYAYPSSGMALANLIQFCNFERLAFFTIGYGTNLLVSDDGFAGCVIDLAEGARNISVGRTTVRPTAPDEELSAGGGAWLGEVVRIAAEHGLSGMERLAGIPGGVGGGMSMNAGAFGMSISDCLVEATVVDKNGVTTVIKKDDVGFGYRSAPGIAGKTVTETIFHLKKEHKSRIIRTVESTITDRFRRNVMTLPSAGSVFKNPIGGFSAKMVEAVGGKGLREGGVEVSQLHGNFIVNTGAGNASDIVKLINRIRSMVRERFDVSLELEVRTLGFVGDILEDYKTKVI